MQIDSLKVVHDTIVIYKNSVDLLDTVTKVDGFYMNAWSVYTTIFGLFGIVLGVIFPIYQSRSTERKIKSLKKELKELKGLKGEYVNIKKDVEELKVLKYEIDNSNFEREVRFMLDSYNRLFETRDYQKLREIYLNGFKFKEDYFNKIFEEAKRRKE